MISNKQPATAENVATYAFRRRSRVMSTATFLPRFLGLSGGLFSAFGVASPFLPGLLGQDGLGASAIGTVRAGVNYIRLVSGPRGGRLADRVRRPSLALTGHAAAAALVATGYVPARGLLLLLLVSVVHGKRCSAALLQRLG